MSHIRNSYPEGTHRGLLLALIAFAIASPATAAPVDFTGELTVSLGSLGSFTANGAGTADVSPGTLAFTLPAGIFPSSTSTPFTGFPPFTELAVDFDNGSGSFGPGLGLNGGFGAGHFGMTLTGNAALALSPLAFDLFPLFLAGNGGTFLLPPTPTSILSTVWGAWTTGASTRVIQVGTATFTTVAIAGQDLRDSDGLGMISLVTPMTVFQGSDPFFEVPLFATMTLHFTPEPSALMLMAMSAFVLARLGMARGVR